MRQHLSILAVLHFLLSAFGLFVAGTVLIATLGAGAFIGIAHAPDVPFGTGLLVGTVGTLVSLFFAVLAFPGLALAYGLWKLRPWARVLGIVLGVLELFHFPFGTVVGAYTLWAMFQPETKALLESERSLYA
jgi:hypothetical protein